MDNLCVENPIHTAYQRQCRIADILAMKLNLIHHYSVRDTRVFVWDGEVYKNPSNIRLPLCYPNCIWIARRIDPIDGLGDINARRTLDRKSVV
jgi:hypothetical protein